jgi:hypothetical protein
MKFRLNGELKLWVEGLEIEGDDIDDAIRKFISNPQDVAEYLENSDDLYVDGIDYSDDTTIELYEKEIDAVISDIEWQGLEDLPLDSQKKIKELPSSFTLENLTIDNYGKPYGRAYYQYNPINEENEDACIKEALSELIWNKYCISIGVENIKSFDKEITNEQ